MDEYTRKRDRYTIEDLLEELDKLSDTDHIRDQYRTSFSFKLLSFLSSKENSVICPLGILALLAMAAEGANDAAREEIVSATGFESLAQLRETVLAIDSESGAFKSDNSISYAELHLLESFRQAAQEQYCAAISEKTIDIPSVELSNIATFQAEWLFPMKRKIGHQYAFYNADGSCCYPAFLSCKQTLFCYDGWDTQAVAISYQSHGSAVPYELVLVAGDELSHTQLDRISNQMQKREIKVLFPEFSVDNRFDFIPIMKQLGMCTIFDEQENVFDRMAVESVYVKAFDQQATIQVDKNGTIATAETRMEFRTLGMQDGEWRFDRPFVYFIRNTETNQIIFVGKINHLEDCEPEPIADDFDISDFFEQLRK